MSQVKNIEDMNYKELRQEVQLLRDELARFKRSYEDIIYNLDTDNFSSAMVKKEKAFRSEIRQTADKISFRVQEMDKSMAEFSVTADEISARVDSLNGNVASLSVKADNISVRVNDLDGNVSDLSAKAGEISSMVKTNITAEFESGVHPNNIIFNPTDEQKKMLCKYGDKYYYYSEFYDRWEEYPDGGLKTFFKQDGTTFILDGDVVITSNVRVKRLYSEKGSYYAAMYSDWGDFGVYTADNTGTSPYNNEKCVWGVYNSDEETNVTNLWIRGQNYFGYNKSKGESGISFPKGDWSFGSCKIVDWGSNQPKAVFA